MGTAAPVKIPPLPAFTAGQWLTVFSKQDDTMARRWLSVMHQMDRRYQQEGVVAFNRTWSHCPTRLGASYYYWAPAHEAVLRIAFNSDRKCHEIGSVGFLGDISPARALDLMVDRAVLHMVERGIKTVFATCPKQMDYAPLLELYDLVPSHPRVRVTSQIETSTDRKWFLEAVELSDSARG